MSNKLVKERKPVFDEEAFINIATEARGDEIRKIDEKNMVKLFTKSDSSLKQKPEIMKECMYLARRCFLLGFADGLSNYIALKKTWDTEC